MVILIGGAGGSGKTRLAKILMEDSGIPYFPLDHLMMGLYRSQSIPGFSPLNSDEKINEVMWPIVQEMVKTNIENRHNQIFEGFQIFPKNIRKIPDEYRNQVNCVFLSLDRKYIKDNYQLILNYRSAIESRNDIDEVELMIMKNEEIQKECESNGQKCYKITGNYENQIKMVAKDIRLTMIST